MKVVLLDGSLYSSSLCFPLSTALTFLCILVCSLTYSNDLFQMDSMEKLNALLDACSELGVDTGPKTIGDLAIIPLFSWYHKVAYFSSIHDHTFSNQVIMHHVTRIFVLTRLA
jgi:hypothetical protein